MNWIKGNGLIGRCAKVAMVVIALQTIVGAQIIKANDFSAGAPYYAKGKDGNYHWFSLYYVFSSPKSKYPSESYTTANSVSNFIGWYNSTLSNNRPTFPIYSPIGNCLYFRYYIDKSTGQSDYNYKGYTAKWGDDKPIYTWAQTSAYACVDSLNKWKSRTITHSETTRGWIYFQGDASSNGGAFIDSIQIPLAEHISVNSYTNTATCPVGQAVDIEIPFKSFLLHNDRITVTSNDAANFKIKDYNGNIVTASSVVVAQFTSGNVCGVQQSEFNTYTNGSFYGANNRAGNASNCNIHILYYPATQGTHNATFTIYDGDATTGTQRVTVTITGTSTSTVQPYYDGSDWYSLYDCNTTHSISSGSNRYSVYPPNKLGYYCKINYVTNGNHLKLQIGSVSGSHYTSDGNGEKTYNVWNNNNHNMENATYVEVQYNSGSGTATYKDLKMTLKQHIRFITLDSLIKGTNTITKSFGTVAVGKYEVAPVELRSFLLEHGKIIIKMASGNNPNVFRFNNQAGDAILSGIEIANFNQNVVCGVANGAGDFTSTPGNASDYNFNIYYYPSKAANETATFKLYDGDGTELATINVSGTGADFDHTKNNLSTGAKPIYMAEQGVTGNPYKWFSTFANYTSSQQFSCDGDYRDHSVYPPCKTSLIIFYGTSHSTLTNQIKIFKDQSFTQYEVIDMTCGGSWNMNFGLSSSELTRVRVQQNFANYEVWYNNLQIELANHVRLYDSNNSKGVPSQDKTISTAAGTAKQCTVYLRSFLTATNLKMKVVNKNDDQASTLFKIVSVGDTVVNATTYTITDCANICGFRDGTTAITTFDNPGVSVNTELLPIVIEYYTTTASAEGGDKARLVFYDDGTSQTATVNLTGTASVPTMSVTKNYMDRHSQQKLTININNTDITGYTINLSVNETPDESDKTVVAINETQGITSANIDNLTITAKNKGAAQIIATVTAPNINEQTCTLNVTVQNNIMAFTGTQYNGSWFTAGNWSTSGGLTIVEIPDETDEVSIQNDCVIPNCSTAVAKSLAFSGDDAKLTINPQGVLNVSGVITNTDATKLLLKAEDLHSASVLFDCSDCKPKATVECWFRGKSTRKSTESTSADYNIMIPQWQYRGFIGKPDKSVGDTAVWLIRDVLYYKWLESNNNTNASNCWDEANPNKNPDPWDGFSMANISETAGTVRTYTTTLIPTANATHQFTMTKSGNKTTSGLNLFTNSYSAPAKIAYITFDENVANKEIVLFNTMSYQEVIDARNDDTKKSSIYVTCPIESSEALNITHIPAGGSFFCFTTTGDEHITIKPDTAASGKMLAPRKDNFNVLKIYAESESERDEVYLVESDNCTHNYDNGYDGTKYFTDGMGQIYGKNDFGKTFIAADSSMLGQMIGFRAGSNDMTYTLRFDIDRLSGYDELYLYDRVTKRYINILDGSSYYFTGSTDGEDERFQVIGRMEDGDSFITGSDHAIEVVSDRALLRGFDGEDETIYITDLAGKVLWSDNAKNGPWFNLPTNIASGLYIIHCGDATAKYLAK